MYFFDFATTKLAAKFTKALSCLTNTPPQFDLCTSSGPVNMIRARVAYGIKYALAISVVVYDLPNLVRQQVMGGGKLLTPPSAALAKSEEEVKTVRSTLHKLLAIDSQISPATVAAADDTSVQRLEGLVAEKDVQLAAKDRLIDELRDRVRVAEEGVFDAVEDCYPDDEAAAEKQRLEELLAVERAKVDDRDSHIDALKFERFRLSTALNSAQDRARKAEEIKDRALSRLSWFEEQAEAALVTVPAAMTVPAARTFSRSRRATPQELEDSIMRLTKELRELKADLEAAADCLPAKTVVAFLDERREAARAAHAAAMAQKGASAATPAPAGRATQGG